MDRSGAAEELDVVVDAGTSDGGVSGVEEADDDDRRRPEAAALVAAAEKNVDDADDEGNERAAGVDVVGVGDTTVTAAARLWLEESPRADRPAPLLPPPPWPNLLRGRADRLVPSAPRLVLRASSAWDFASLNSRFIRRKSPSIDSACFMCRFSMSSSAAARISCTRTSFPTAEAGGARVWLTLPRRTVRRVSDPGSEDPSRFSDPVIASISAAALARASAAACAS